MDARFDIDCFPFTAYLSRCSRFLHSRHHFSCPSGPRVLRPNSSSGNHRSHLPQRFISTPSIQRCSTNRVSIVPLPALAMIIHIPSPSHPWIAHFIPFLFPTPCSPPIPCPAIQKRIVAQRAKMNIRMPAPGLTPSLCGAICRRRIRAIAHCRDAQVSLFSSIFCI